jgi:hypothetical protein
MWNNIGTWYFWVFVVIVILIILWIVTKYKTPSNQNLSRNSLTVESSDDEYEYVRRRKTHKPRKGPSKNVGSSYDSVPDYEIIDDALAQHHRELTAEDDILSGLQNEVANNLIENLDTLMCADV